MIYHIYWGTSGNSGLYLDEIYQVLKKEGYNQRVFVNYYYPFDYGDKIFFKRGDVAQSKHKDFIRKLFQLQEVLLGFIKILFAARIDKPLLINYSHAGESFFFIIWFLRALKKVSGAKLVITCHDVNPHSSNPGEIKNRQKIFNSSDYLLVHNENSIKELKNNWSINPDKIVIHLFPIMDLSKLTKDDKPLSKTTDFLFIGHLRKDKGIEFLLEVWKDFYMINNKATLKICGRKLNEVCFDENELAKYNIEFNLRFINDDEYYEFVKSSRYVILPYLQGTNSGIISTVLSLGTNVITSDIPMFKENPMVPVDNMFISGNKQSLINKLEQKWNEQEDSSTSILEEYRKDFDDEVTKVYRQLIFE